MLLTLTPSPKHRPHLPDLLLLRVGDLALLPGHALLDVAVEALAEVPDLLGDLMPAFFCFLKKLIGVRMLTTFYLAKNDRRLVTFITLKTITPWSNDQPCARDTGGP